MIILTTAMKKEFDEVVALLSSPIFSQHCNLCSGILNAKDVLVVKTGIGKVNAAMSLTRVLEWYNGVERVVSLGCAGATVPSLQVGDIVIGNSYCYHDVWCGEPNMKGQIQDCPAVFPSAFSDYIVKLDNATIGAIATGDWFVQSKDKTESVLKYLPVSYNVVAVDMESAALAQVCYTNQIPFVAFRVISDNPLLPKQEKQYTDFWQMATSKYFQILTSLV